MQIITQQQITQLKRAGHVIRIMPLKKMVRVDGYKLFYIEQGAKVSN